MLAPPTPPPMITARAWSRMARNVVTPGSAGTGPPWSQRRPFWSADRTPEVQTADRNGCSGRRGGVARAGWTAPEQGL